MGKLISKYIYILICLVLLTVVFLFGFRYKDEGEIYFYLENGSAPIRITMYESEEEYYVFLPSHAEMDRITIGIPFQMTAVLDGEPLKDGMCCEKYSLNKEYWLQVDGGEQKPLRFLRSENIPALYIQTASGSMEEIHRDKERVETAAVQLVTQDGVQKFYHEGCEIKGRGNATWTQDKRPYVLTLPNAEALLGMSSGMNWVLLANAMDETNLRNKLVLDFAREAGLGWTPQCRYVDLYLNGDYNGLYLLCEKVEAGEDRLQLDTQAGDFMCRVDLGMRWDGLRNPVCSQGGRIIEISEPKDISQAQTAAVTEQIGQMEALIFSGRNLAEEPSFDLDSWIRKYLIDEIFSNIDADLASSYFYYRDGVFYAGPLWDYDMTLGNSYRNQDPRTFMAKSLHKIQGELSSYYDALYRNAYFYENMVQVYRTQYAPLLQRYIGFWFSATEDSIAASSEMNWIRWQEMYADIYAYEGVIRMTAEDVKHYLQERMGFLTDVWVNAEAYCTVQYLTEEDSAYSSKTVKSGTVLDADILGLSDEYWAELQEDSTFDLRQPVTEDLLLKPTKNMAESGQEAAGEDIQQTEEKTGLITDTRDVVAVGSILLLGSLLVVMAAVSRRRNRNVRSNSTGTEAGTSAGMKS